MKYLYSYNPPEIAFYIWMTNFPFSGHPLDDERFYSFVLTIHKYKRQGQKWRKREYFIRRIRDFGYCQEEDELNKRFDQLSSLLDFIETKTYPVFRKRSLFNDEFEGTDVKYTARAIINGKLVYKEISDETYKSNKVTKKTFTD